jgi:hypothetical protein
LNIGIIEISNCSLVIDADLIAAFRESNLLKGKNEQLKVMLWVGGADESMGFSGMVENHNNRKRFIQSLKATLEKYALDGVGEFCRDSHSMCSFCIIFFSRSCRLGLGISERIQPSKDSLHAVASRDKTRISERTQHLFALVSRRCAISFRGNVL